MQNELYIVADAIKALREARGLTQEQLAEKADISVSHLAKIETHARLMGMKTYIRLLEAMDIPIKEHFIHMGTAKKDGFGIISGRFLTLLFVLFLTARCAV